MRRKWLWVPFTGMLATLIPLLIRDSRNAPGTLAVATLLTWGINSREATKADSPLSHKVFETALLGVFVLIAGCLLYFRSALLLRNIQPDRVLIGLTLGCAMLLAILVAARLFDWWSKPPRLSP